MVSFKAKKQYNDKKPIGKETPMLFNVNELLERIKKLHFIGIGGSGMFPLVEILLKEGYTITGSDVNEGSIIDLERKLGIDVKIGHNAENVGDAEAVVVTAALLSGNPEVEYAHAHDIPIIERAELLGWVTRHYANAICVCGTHGKTTTTSMLTSMLLLDGIDPSAVIGGKLPLIGGYGRHGESDVLVCEACEFKDTFLHLTPDYAVILNVDADHLDYFGSLEGVIASFNKFAKMTTKKIIANGDDANTKKALEGVDKEIIYFGEGAQNDFVISDVKNYARAFYSFVLSDKNGVIGEFKLSVPGRHNVLNATAALCAAVVLSKESGKAFDLEKLKDGLWQFKGAGRRFEFLGEHGGITIADDYAHHPTEISVTLDAAKKMGYNRVIAVFQPFTFTRTMLLLNEFADALKKADLVVMTEIMGSREINTCGVSTADLAAKIDGSVWFNTFDEVVDYCLSIARDGDLFITLGCGDIYKAAKMMVEKCKEF